MGNVIRSHLFYIYSKWKTKISHWKPGLQTLSCLVWRVCVFPPYGIWGGIAIYVRECLWSTALFPGPTAIPVSHYCKAVLESSSILCNSGLFFGVDQTLYVNIQYSQANQGLNSDNKVTMEFSFFLCIVEQNKEIYVFSVFMLEEFLLFEELLLLVVSLLSS